MPVNGYIDIISIIKSLTDDSIMRLAFSLIETNKRMQQDSMNEY